jgi:hypothetical protein
MLRDDGKETEWPGATRGLTVVGCGLRVCGRVAAGRMIEACVCNKAGTYFELGAVLPR